MEEGGKGPQSERIHATERVGRGAGGVPHNVCGFPEGITLGTYNLAYTQGRRGPSSVRLSYKRYFIITCLFALFPATMNNWNGRLITFAWGYRVDVRCRNNTDMGSEVHVGDNVSDTKKGYMEPPALPKTRRFSGLQFRKERTPKRWGPHSGSRRHGS